VVEADPLIGARLGEFAIDLALGRGTFATVYTGVDRDGARVALKVLHAHHVDSRAAARFQREIAIVRRLDHPNIVRLHAAGLLEDGRPYCVMERLEGRDLSAELELAPLRTTRVVEVVRQVAAALAAAHAARVVHRDVKAANVFACDDGRIVLLDFGIAKLAYDHAITQSRESVGSLGAMSPEQLAAGPVDHRTDIYALGALTFHLLTGRRPFDDLDMAVQVQAHRFAARPSASALGAPIAIDAVIAKAMALRREDRFDSALELADAATAALAGP
jgi:serine/threonine-protein kinase